MENEVKCCVCDIKCCTESPYLIFDLPRIYNKGLSIVETPMCFKCLSIYARKSMNLIKELKNQK